MKALALTFLVLLAACAAPPETPAGDRIDLVAQDEDLRAVVGRIERVSGRRIVLGDDVDESVTVHLHQVRWRDALELVARAYACAVFESDEGTLFVVQGSAVTIRLKDRPLRDCVRTLAARAGLGVVVASDVDGTASVNVHDCGLPRHLARILARFLDEHGLHGTRVGSLLVVSKGPLDVPAPPAGPPAAARALGPTATFVAWHAPARGWFELLRRVTGETVEHGDAPIDVNLRDASVEEVARATALASRVPRPRKIFEDLPPMVELASGQVVVLGLQAVVTRIERPLALIDGHVYAPGEAIRPGLRVGGMNERDVSVSDGHTWAWLRRP